MFVLSTRQAKQQSSKVDLGWQRPCGLCVHSPAAWMTCMHKPLTKPPSCSFAPRPNQSTTRIHVGCLGPTFVSMHKRHGPAHTAPANRPGSHQHPMCENNGTAPQRGADQGHLTCPAPPNNTPTEPLQNCMRETSGSRMLDTHPSSNAQRYNEPAHSITCLLPCQCRWMHEHLNIHVG